MDLSFAPTTADDFEALLELRLEVRIDRTFRSQA